MISKKTRLPAIWFLASLVALGGAVYDSSAANAQWGPYDPRWQTPYQRLPPWLPPLGPYQGVFPVPVPVPVAVPRSVRIASEVIADPPLAPARVELVNSTAEPLRVEIIDLRKGQVIGRRDIQPGSSVVASLARHSGGEAIETYRTYYPNGETSDSEVTRRIPPQVRYELAVHRWQMQSIAIDRTGKSPQAIEDVQFAGQGIGRFRLPTGEALVDGRIDVYQAALGAANPDTVAPIFPSDDAAGRPDPLRQALESLKR